MDTLIQSKMASMRVPIGKPPCWNGCDDLQKGREPNNLNDACKDYFQGSNESMSILRLAARLDSDRKTKLYLGVESLVRSLGPFQAKRLGEQYDSIRLTR